MRESRAEVLHVVEQDVLTRQEAAADVQFDGPCQCVDDGVVAVLFRDDAPPGTMFVARADHVGGDVERHLLECADGVAFGDAGDADGGLGQQPVVALVFVTACQCQQEAQQEGEYAGIHELVFLGVRRIGS